MKPYFVDIILRATGATKLFEIEQIQNLWSGYGEIVRFGLEGAEIESVVVKHVNLPEGKNHPRGWNTDLSHQRKLKSYKVETTWYKNYGKYCNDNCKIPDCYALDKHGNNVLMVLEDLDASAYNERRNSSVSWTEVNACISWLANFHASFLGKKPEGLWQIGTYWQLDTRPEELEVLDDIPLKNAAAAIDKKLNNCTFKTFVHGDAKLANFCFSEDGAKVAAVDFQYVGGGCGMKDLAYIIGSCMSETDCERFETKILEYYFNELKNALISKNLDFNTLEAEWRQLYYFAWADFHRFVKGWQPGHWKINSYSERISRKVINEVNKWN